MHSQVTAKVKLTNEVKCYQPGADPDSVPDSVNLQFTADYDDPRNKAWAKYTPALLLTMTVKPEAAENFTVGSNYTLIFVEDL